MPTTTLIGLTLLLSFSMPTITQTHSREHASIHNYRHGLKSEVDFCCDVAIFFEKSIDFLFFLEYNIYEHSKTLNCVCRFRSDLHRSVWRKF